MLFTMYGYILVRITNPFIFRIFDIINELNIVLQAVHTYTVHAVGLKITERRLLMDIIGAFRWAHSGLLLVKKNKQNKQVQN